MLREGLYETDYTYYLKLGTFIMTIFTLGITLSAGLIGGGTVGMRLLGGVFLGLFFQQLAGIGHDLGA
jgi:delta8-fatty-acid desaturase